MDEADRLALRQHQIDELYRAIGRFVVEFSQLLHRLETMTVLLMAAGSAAPQQRTWALLAGRTAQPIVDGYFALLAEIHRDRWTDEDWRLVKGVRKEISDLIARRNRLSHDAWFVGWGNEDTVDFRTATRRRLSSSPSDGARFTAAEFRADQLEAEADDIRRLSSVAASIGHLELLEKRPSEVLRVDDDGRVVRVNWH